MKVAFRGDSYSSVDRTIARKMTQDLNRQGIKTALETTANGMFVVLVDDDTPLTSELYK